MTAPAALTTTVALRKPGKTVITQPSGEPATGKRARERWKRAYGSPRRPTTAATAAPRPASLAGSPRATPRDTRRSGDEGRAGGPPGSTPSRLSPSRIRGPTARAPSSSGTSAETAAPNAIRHSGCLF